MGVSLCCAGGFLVWGCNCRPRSWVRLMRSLMWGFRVVVGARIVRGQAVVVVRTVLRGGLMFRILRYQSMNWITYSGSAMGMSFFVAVIGDMS